MMRKLKIVMIGLTLISVSLWSPIKAYLPGDEYWWDGFEGNGVNADVGTFAIYDDQLIVGGSFTTAGGLEANRIVNWDGASWQPLGEGANDIIKVLAVYNGELIIGGNFTEIGGLPIRYLAKWDGYGWSSFGNFDGSVRCLVEWEGLLVAGGSFEIVNGSSCHFIASWNGQEWLSLESGTSFIVNALAVYQDDLIIGGSFNLIGEQYVNYIARWDGIKWYPLEQGLEDIVKALCVYNGELIVGGNFDSTENGLILNHVGSWDGSSWSNLGEGVVLGRGRMGSVSALAIYNSDLIVGGQFDWTGDYWMNRIGKWDGETWTRMGSGISGARVSELQVYGPSLFVGGEFYTAGEQESHYIARWDEGLTGVTKPDVGHVEVLSYPNPFGASVTVQYVSPAEVTGKVTIYSITGRLVRHLHEGNLSVGINQWGWNGLDNGGWPVPAGIYFCRVNVGERSSTAKITIAR